jgi:GntR family transcriptional regulator/MocR family aminotransferase
MELYVSLTGHKDLSGEIYRQLRRAILERRLLPGQQLASTRELARLLGVSRTTVTVAFERLWSEGFVTSHTGAGTFVSADAAAERRRAQRRARPRSPLRIRPVWDTIPLTTVFERPAAFDFRTGATDVSLFPFESWRRLMVRQFQKSTIGTGAYGSPAGHAGLRAAIARHIAVSRGVQASPDDIVITSGTQQALDIVARILLAPGDRVAVEDPGYRPPRLLFESLGARVRGVAVDRHGLVVDQIPNRARLVYVTPSHQYPLGMSMALARRLELLEWAERYNAAVIEDDYDSEFRFGGRPIESLQSLDVARRRVVYVGSFSKTLLPALRLGFLVTPPALRDAALRAKYVTDWHTPLHTQAALATFMEEGLFARHLRKMNSVYRARHQRLTSILEHDFTEYFDVIPSAAGLHVAAVARSSSSERFDAVLAAATQARLALQPLSIFAFDHPPRLGLVLGYGAIGVDGIEEGLRRLRDCFGAAHERVDSTFE